MADRFLYLDDVRTPEDPGWEIVRSYEDFVMVVRLNGLESYSHISLDHDLGDTAMSEYYTNVKPNYSLNYDNIIEKTGYDVCKWLVAESMNKNIPLPMIYVHSANPIGSANMMGYINNYYKNCRMEEKCIRIQIPHTIEESLVLTPEQRKARWQK